MIAQRNGQQRQARRGKGDVDPALDDAVEALQRDVVDVDDGDAVQILEPRPQRDDLQEIGHDLDVHALAARALDELEHLHVLVGWQRDVEMIDRLANGDFRRLLDAAEERQTAVAEVIARCLDVHEADDLVAELAMFEDLVGDEPPELPGRPRSESA